MPRQLTTKRRRSPGDGTVYTRRDGRHVAARTVGQTAAGNPRRVYGYGRTDAEARRRLDERIAELGGLAAAAARVGTPRPTLEEWARSWLAHKRATASLRAGTLAWYQRALELYAIPALGRLRVDRLRPAHISALLTQLATRTPPLRPVSIRNVRAVLRAALEHAVRLELIRSNPATAVPCPPLGPPTREAWEPEEGAAFLQAADGHRLRVLFLLALATGARLGELLALRRDDVDQVAGTLRIARSRSPQGVETAPKSRAGLRTLPLPADVLEALSAHLEATSGSPYLFHRRDGRPLTPHQVEHAMDVIISRATPPVRRLTPHGLRHTAATLALRAGVLPHVVARRLGHSNAAITLRVYAHVLSDQAQDGALSLAELLSGRRGEVPRERDEVAN